MVYCALGPLKTQHRNSNNITNVVAIPGILDPLLVPVSTQNDRTIIILGYVFWPYLLSSGIPTIL